MASITQLTQKPGEPPADFTEYGTSSGALSDVSTNAYKLNMLRSDVSKHVIVVALHSSMNADIGNRLCQFTLWSHRKAPTGDAR